MYHVLAFATAVADDTNRPLAIGTAVVSAVLIALGIVYIARHREVGTATDEDLLKALDSVEWFASDFGDDLVAADGPARQELVDGAGKRIGAAHAALLANAPLVDNRRWEQLVVELTNTESAYRAFAQADGGDEGAVAQHQHVLTEKLDAFRDGLGEQ